MHLKGLMWTVINILFFYVMFSVMMENMKADFLSPN